MKRTHTLVIGGGQAGLAMSSCLLHRGIDHVVLERGRVAERWRSERWDSLRLLTPRWQTRLPGWYYRGSDPDGYMTRDELVTYLEGYAASFAAPVETGAEVTSVERSGSGFSVTTAAGAWRARNVVVATGHCMSPSVPSAARALPSQITQEVPTGYRHATALPAGGVLVVGASSTGLQLAEEIRRSGRAVTLAVGGHTRLPRSYRGRDIQFWLEAMGVWNDTAGHERDLDRARREHSLQLIGSPEHRSIDLAHLQRVGVRLVGRLQGVEGRDVLLAPDLGDTMAAAHRRLERLLGRIDEFIQSRRLPERRVAPDRPAAVPVPAAPRTLDLEAAGIRTVLWATGYRRSYPWLASLDVLDERGEIRHDGGVTAAPGLYVLGLQFLRTRKSSFIDGVGPDAAFLADHILARGSNRVVAA
jgi:putative flavoprotein involved in K+ transport